MKWTGLVQISFTKCCVPTEHEFEVDTFIAFTCSYIQRGEHRACLLHSDFSFFHFLNMDKKNKIWMKCILVRWLVLLFGWGSRVMVCVQCPKQSSGADQHTPCGTVRIHTKPFSLSYLCLLLLLLLVFFLRKKNGTQKEEENLNRLLRKNNLEV